MQKKLTAWKTKGMNQDLSVSAFNPEFAFENKNLRLTATGGNTTMSWVNEKGTKRASVRIIQRAFPNNDLYTWIPTSRLMIAYPTLVDERMVMPEVNYILGHPIGTAFVNEYLVLFTTNTVKTTGYSSPYPSEEKKFVDFIYVLYPSKNENDNTDFYGYLMYAGNLNFDKGHPLETLVSYEADNINKIYFTDGINLPRLFSIDFSEAGLQFLVERLIKWNSTEFIKGVNANLETTYTLPVDTWFDFVTDLKLEETVKVKKLLSASGAFPSGVIQYAFTYYNKYGQESNIFYTTPLLYVSYLDRGAAADAKVSNAFLIFVENVDTLFDYLRIYSIQRTSINATPICKRVQDIYLKNLNNPRHIDGNDVYDVSYVDTGVSGDAIDPVELLYKGGDEIAVGTFEQKDGTLFLGNIKTLGKKTESNLDTIINRVQDNDSELQISTVTKDIYVNLNSTGAYEYFNQLNSKDDSGYNVPCSYFKGQEYYRLGVQLQYKTGKWSKPIPLNIKDSTDFHKYYKLDKVYPDIKSIINKLIIIESNPDLSDFTNLSTIYNAEAFHITDNDTENDLYIKENILKNDEFIYRSFFDLLPLADVLYTYPDLIVDSPNSRENQDYEHRVWIKFDSRDNEVQLILPIIQGKLTDTLAEELLNLGYKKIRPVVVFPSIQDRNILCQGVVNPTVYTTHNRTNNLLHSQSSWFFRPQVKAKYSLPNGSCSPFLYKTKTVGNVTTEITTIPYTDKNLTTYSPSGIRCVEIQGLFNPENQFQVDRQSWVTFHSPDIEFDTLLQVCSYEELKAQLIGISFFKSTMSDIDIQMETPTMSNLGSGFIYKTFSNIDKLATTTFGTNNGYGSHGIISGLFYDDVVLDDCSSGLLVATGSKVSVKWLVYPWNKSGSLNNDINRPSSLGTATSILKKKIISNLRYSLTKYTTNALTSINFLYDPQLFFSNEVDVIKFTDGALYEGNIDTLLAPDSSDGMYYAFAGTNGDSYKDPTIVTGFNPVFDNDVEVLNLWWKTFAVQETVNSVTAHLPGLYRYGADSENPTWAKVGISGTIGNEYLQTVLKKDSVRMKYKSTAHLVLRPVDSNTLEYSHTESSKNWYGLPVVELYKNKLDTSILFGGDSVDALRENIWIPCGEPVRLDKLTTEIVTPADPEDPNSVDITRDVINFNYSYGDTYYQRWDCLKTYPFTTEDINQIVEIGSFMLETKINIDGRYDKNRGQQSNLYMSPLNFNLLNPVYSQTDNFFNYKILDDTYYTNNSYPNLIAWSRSKESGADVDAWTLITLGSTLEMDGDRGEIKKLIRYNDVLLAFQDRCISQILYNENVQISSTDGVPIEIANSGKVQGKRTISDTVGCSNKFSMVSTPNGIYFSDSYEKNIYRYNGQLENLTSNLGFNNWSKNNIDSYIYPWDPYNFKGIVSYYNTTDQEVLFITKDTCLAFSEKLNIFTSFYNYEDTPYYLQLGNKGIWFRKSSILDELDLGTEPPAEEAAIAIENTKLFWHHQGGNCNFFGELKPYYTILVGNPEPLTDKVFTNLEFRACVENEGTVLNNEINEHYLPFDTLEAWDEYLHGYFTLLENNCKTATLHHERSFTSLLRRFRIWRCDIPRDNAIVPKVTVSPDHEEYQSQIAEVNAFKEDEAKKGITRFKARPLDRMRNPWIYLKLTKSVLVPTIDPAYIPTSLPKTEIHDVVMTYYN